MGTNSINDVFEKFCDGVSLFGPFWDHVLGYWNLSKENPDRILFLRFEDVKEKPGIYLRRLSGFLGCPFSGEEEETGVVDEILRLCSFDNLRGLEVNMNGRLESGEVNSAFFRKGEVGDWRNCLDRGMVDRLDGISEERFRGSGLEL
ncbi:cytosolic sulfotransferase 5 [Phtheirospermum japonicum]|uniref:Sulfotransferase n=1 Tax=Phtheirospermum japonicum TaxID=374723 RepID=A0A830BS50_9LAMI|nr:cytosolic sulfotransferase 5 [Phtheirospermum japonicum]